MKAVVYEKYCSPKVLKIKDIEKPKPKEDEILVKIHAATVTSGDVRLRSSNFSPLFWLPARLIFGLFRPKKKILGHEFSGVIEAVGKHVTRFNIGDSVFGTTTMLRTGSHAEYIALPQEWKHGVVELMPENVSFKEAAALPVGAMTAMFLLEKANLSSEQNVLIYGASGSVGSYAVQLASHGGNTVTGVSSASNFEMVTSLGADKMINYKTEDYTLSNETYDIIFDAVGKTSKSKAKRVLKPGGAFVSVRMLTKEKREHLKRIKTMAEHNKLRPYIDRTFNLKAIVKPHQYVDSGRKKGNVVINII